MDRFCFWRSSWLTFFDNRSRDFNMGRGEKWWI
jgi:hypothetical protein